MNLEQNKFTRRKTLRLLVSFLIGINMPEKICALEIDSKKSLKGGLRDLWEISVEKNLEFGSYFTKLNNGKTMWLPTKIISQNESEVEMIIEWDRVKDISGEISEITEVHVHPPRTLLEYMKENLETVDKEDKIVENEFIVDPPSIADISKGFERAARIPPEFKGKIKFSGTVASIGGVWKFTEVGKVLNVTEFNRNAKILKDRIKKIACHGARFKGNVLLMRQDNTGKGEKLYQELMSAYKNLGVTVEFVGNDSI